MRKYKPCDTCESQALWRFGWSNAFWRPSLIALLLCFALFAARPAAAYNVWLGTHQWDGDGAQNLDQWDRARTQIEGVNYVLLDGRTDKKATATEWSTMIGTIDQSIPGMAEIARSQYQPAKNVTLASRLKNEFDTVEKRGGVIDVMMLYDEERNGTVYSFTADDVQEVRDWLDANGEGHVQLCFNLRNNNQERLGIARLALIDGIMIEASATRWVKNQYNLHTLLQTLWSDARTNYKPLYFQIPRSEDAAYAQYQETRRALRTISDLMGDDFMRSDLVNFIVCNYSDRLDLYPETSDNDTKYVDSKSGIALSLIEQKSVFEGRSGTLDEAFCLSYDRQTVDLGVPFDAVMFDAESDPGNENRIRDAGTHVGYIVDGTWVRYDDFDFGDEGSGLIEIVAATPNSGRVEVRIDSPTGTLLGTVTVSSTGSWSNYQAFSKKISTRTGSKDLYFVFKGGSGGLFNLRSFTLSGRAAGRAEVFTENSSGLLVYSGTWSTQSNSGDRGGSIRWSGASGSSVSLAFVGDRVAVGVRKGPYGGMCKIYLDGVLKATVNTYSSTTSYQQLVYDSGRLWAYGSHTIKLEASGGGNVMFDYFSSEQ